MSSKLTCFVLGELCGIVGRWLDCLLVACWLSAFVHRCVAELSVDPCMFSSCKLTRDTLALYTEHRQKFIGLAFFDSWLWPDVERFYG